MPIVMPDPPAAPSSPPSVPFDFTGRPGLTLYSTVTNDQRQTFVSASGTLVATAGVNQAAAAVAMPESVPHSGLYVGRIPGSLPAGLYLLPIWRQVGSVPATTDPRYGTGYAELPGSPFDWRGLSGAVLVLDWSGSAVSSLASLADSRGPGSRPLALPAPQASIIVAQQIVTALYAARLQLAAQGFASVTIDGQETVFRSPGQVDAEIATWERKVALLSGRRRRVRSM